MQSEGEYREIDDEVDWNLEIGAIIRRAEETLSPMPIFNRVLGLIRVRRFKISFCRPSYVCAGVTLPIDS
jgi:UbiD family decarboxylase